jgi:hypothetical protein
MSIADQMLVAFCFADDFLKNHPNLARWRTSNHANPKFSDAEVITIALMQAIFQVATLKQAYLLSRASSPMLSLVCHTMPRFWHDCIRSLP